MKIILSRKGFDSKNGGIVSPILPDGSLLSFPIPSELDKDTFDDLFYQEVPYSSFLQDLRYKGKYCHCHADPDLDMNRRQKTIEGWFPAFGQVGASASYLFNKGVEVGDVFLFFGNFHCVEMIDGHIRYKKTGDSYYENHDIQVIWGYLQIGEILTSPEEQATVFWHPHSTEKRRNAASNVIFKAAKSLSWNADYPGAGLLKLSQQRILTLEGASKATWKKHPIYDVDNICASRKNRAKNPKEGIYYPGIWQELVLKETDECKDWAEQVISAQ